MLNSTKFPVQVFCNREMQTAPFYTLGTGQKLVLVFNYMIIKSITPKKGRRQDTAGRQDAKKRGAVCNMLYINTLQPFGRTAPNFPIYLYINGYICKKNIFFQPEFRCRPAVSINIALKVLQTLTFSRTGSKIAILPAGAV
jgi:hypothetical protein